MPGKKRGKLELYYRDYIRPLQIFESVRIAISYSRPYTLIAEGDFFHTAPQHSNVNNVSQGLGTADNGINKSSTTDNVYSPNTTNKVSHIPTISALDHGQMASFLLFMFPCQFVSNIVYALAAMQMPQISRHVFYLARERLLLFCGVLRRVQLRFREKKTHFFNLAYEFTLLGDLCPFHRLLRRILSRIHTRHVCLAAIPTELQPSKELRIKSWPFPVP